MWGIPDWLEEKVRKRDKFCVFCHVRLKEYPRAKKGQKDRATWEHIDNDGPNSELNVVRYCSSCNASKGAKKLSVWLESPYCKEKRISKETIMIPARRA